MRAILIGIGALACSEAPRFEPAARADAGSGGELSDRSGRGESAAGGRPGQAGLAGMLPVSMGGISNPPGTGGESAGGHSPSAGNGNGASAGSDPSSACDPRLTSENRALVATALDTLFVDKQLSAVDRYWADPYLQHNPIASSGVAAFKGIMGSLVSSPSFSYERLRTLAECDLAVVQGRYSASGVIFDLFRIKNGRLIEHWDSDAGQASDAGGTTCDSPASGTSHHRQAVVAFIQAVLIEARYAEAPTYLSPGFVAHRAPGVSGPAALIGLVTAESITYTRVHHVIADGGFVFTLSEGALGGVPHAFYDLFRLESGQVVEHWGSRRRVPSSTASGLGIF